MNGVLLSLGGHSLYCSYSESNLGPQESRLGWSTNNVNFVVLSSCHYITRALIFQHWVFFESAELAFPFRCLKLMLLSGHMQKQNPIWTGRHQKMYVWCGLRVSHFTGNVTFFNYRQYTKKWQKLTTSLWRKSLLKEEKELCNCRPHGLINTSEATVAVGKINKFLSFCTTAACMVFVSFLVAYYYNWIFYGSSTA